MSIGLWGCFSGNLGTRCCTKCVTCKNFKKLGCQLREICKAIIYEKVFNIPTFQALIAPELEWAIKSGRNKEVTWCNWTAKRLKNKIFQNLEGVKFRIQKEWLKTGLAFWYGQVVDVCSPKVKQKLGKAKNFPLSGIFTIPNMWWNQRLKCIT